MVSDPFQILGKTFLYIALGDARVMEGGDGVGRGGVRGRRSSCDRVGTRSAQLSYL